MNAREGMRRLGLAVALLGASAGAVVAFPQLQRLLLQRGQSLSFQALVSCPTAMKEVEALTLARKGVTRANLNDVPDDVLDKTAAFCGGVDGWKVNRNGIGAIHFSSDSQCTASEISMIETENGQRVYRADPPSLRSYLLVLALPILGFIVPWGAIRMLTWIALGFFS